MSFLKSLIQIPIEQQLLMVAMIWLLCFVITAIILARFAKSVERFGGHMTDSLVTLISSMLTAALLITILLTSWFSGFRHLMGANWVYLVASPVFLLISVIELMALRAVLKDIDKRTAIGTIRSL